MTGQEEVFLTWLRGGLDWISEKNFLTCKGLSNSGTGGPGKLCQNLWRHLKHVHLRTWFRGIFASVKLMTGLNGIKDLFLSNLNDSIIVKLISNRLLIIVMCNVVNYFTGNSNPFVSFLLLLSLFFSSAFFFPI